MNEENKIEIVLTRAPKTPQYVHNHQTSQMENLQELGTAVCDGDMIISLANLYQDEEALNKIEEIFELNCKEKNTINYLIKTHEDINSEFGELISDLIVMNTINEYCDKDTEFTALVACDKLKNDLDTICSFAEVFADTATTCYQRQDKLLYCTVLDFLGTFEGKVSYFVYPSHDFDKISFIDMYSISNSKSALELDLAFIAKEDVIIKKCNNCGKYFKPSSRSDEIYCNNVYKNGRTCKQIGYENKVKSDEVLREYRKIYKTQNARKQRNKHNIKNIDFKFSQWANDAKDQLELCKQGEIDLATFISNISSDEWIKGDD